MLKKALVTLLALVVMLVLFLLPTAIRRGYYYDGEFETREIPRPKLETIAVSAPEMPAFEDRFDPTAAGAILLDAAHENRFDVSELSVLQARLSARGQRLELLESVWDLPAKLRYAKALVVISPGESFATDEIQQLEDFVEKGGRLLLITDPTRFGLRFDDYGYVLGLDSDVMYINELAARFGLVFQSDYLYNTVEHEGNYRNIKLTELAETDLTAGVEQLVFYATHSIRSDQTALVVAGGETRSSSSERIEELAVATLAADGAVLALGDLTFMVEPQNAVYDNELFIAHIADWLSGGERRYELADFPFFFAEQVDLIYTDAPLLDTDLLVGSTALQAYFAGVGKELAVRDQEDPTRDTLFLGVYAHTQDVSNYLAAAGVALTVVTPTAATPVPTPTLDLSATVTGTEESTLTTTVELTGVISLSPTVRSRVEITTVGQIVVTGTALLALQTDGERHVLTVLAYTETGLDNVVERLTQSGLGECLILEAASGPNVTLALCPTGEVAEGEGEGGWQGDETEPTPTATPAPDLLPTPVPTGTQPTETPVGEPEGKIFVVALDDGEPRYDGLTGAEDFAEILDDRFEVTVWSVARDGLPGEDEAAGHDLLILAKGDFEGALGDAFSEWLGNVMLAGTPVILSGAYFDESAELAVQRDIQVEDAAHPLAQGFAPDEVITFVASPSGREYEIGVVDAETEEGGQIVFVRGPDSETAGAASIVVLDDLLGIRIALIGFPVYLLPEEARTRLVNNTVDWALGQSE